MSSPQRGDVFGTRYRLEKRLGRGGMASVWEAHDRRLKRRVALKVLLACHSDKDDAIARFAGEARVVAQLQSPHIVQLHDVGVHDGQRPYIVMELLEGEQLNLRLNRCGRLPINACVRLADHLGKALATAHAAGIIHRDLKPGNVFLVKGHREEIAKVFDFGISKALQPLDDRAQTHGDLVLGTPRYMSPEQISGAEIDHRADLWAFGVMMYRAVTGRVPFDAVELKELIHAVTDGALPSVGNSVPAAIVAPLDAFFARALAKDSSQRFGDAIAMSEALVGVLSRAALPPRPQRAAAAPAPAEVDEVIELDVADLLTIEDIEPVEEPAYAEPVAPIEAVERVEEVAQVEQVEQIEQIEQAARDEQIEQIEEPTVALVAQVADVAAAPSAEAPADPGPARIACDSERPVDAWETTIAIPLERADAHASPARKRRWHPDLALAALVASCAMVVGAALSLEGSAQTARAAAVPHIWIDGHASPPSAVAPPALVTTAPRAQVTTSSSPARPVAAAQPVAAPVAPEPSAEAAPKVHANAAPPTATPAAPPIPPAAAPEKPQPSPEAKPRGRALFEEPW